MKNQTPTTTCLPSQQQQQQQLAIIPYNQGILPVNITNQPPKPDTTTRINPSFPPKKNSNLMEEFQRQLLTTTFIRVMSFTSFSHLVLGFELLDKTGLSSSIYPIVMSLFKYSLVIFASFSIACAIKSPTCRNTRFLSMFMILPLAHFLSPIAEKYKRIFYYMCGVSYMSWLGGFSCGNRKRGWHVNFGLYWFMHTIVFPIGARVNPSSSLVLVFSTFCGAFSAAPSSDLDLSTSSAPSLLCFLDKSIKTLLPAATERVKSTLKEKKIGKFIKCAIGLAGTLLFQNFFRLTTFDHVKAFIYFATSWIANLALINAYDDFGILNFILGNMILGSTVSQYGLRITTWFTYGVCLFLYILGIKLKSMKTSQNIENLPRPPFLFWIFYCCIVFDFLFSPNLN